MKNNIVKTVIVTLVMSVEILTACGNTAENKETFTESRVETTTETESTEENAESTPNVSETMSGTSDEVKVNVVSRGADLPISMPVLRGEMLDGSMFDDDNYWSPADVTLVYVWDPSTASADELEKLNDIRTKCGSSMQILGLIANDEKSAAEAKDQFEKSGISFDVYKIDPELQREVIDHLPEGSVTFFVDKFTNIIPDTLVVGVDTEKNKELFDAYQTDLAEQEKNHNAGN